MPYQAAGTPPGWIAPDADPAIRRENPEGILETGRPGSQASHTTRGWHFACRQMMSPPGCRIDGPFSSMLTTCASFPPDFPFPRF